MAGPAVLGRWLKRAGNGARRLMAVHDRTRLIGPLKIKYDFTNLGLEGHDMKFGKRRLVTWDWGMMGLKLFDRNFDILTEACVGLVCAVVAIAGFIILRFSRVCPNCGKNVVAKGSCCPHCGQKL